MSKIDLLTLFPKMAEGFLTESILGRASTHGLLDINIHNLRDWSTDKHHKVDDRPFGGGAGMVLMPEPLFAAIEEIKTPDTTTIYLCPDGEPLSTPMARELAELPHLLLISGHYEGVDQRVRDALVDREVSIGDYVLTNGTLPAAVLIDCVARQIPGVLGEEKSLTQDSFNDNFLTFPQFTRPAEYRGMKVPEVLLSGDHAAIERWREEERRRQTRLRRPDLNP
ncbi:MAG: tRNA (guanosine(37)-N1)-methyltransferase TrmD [Puniceicoccales bacterium]